MNYDSAIADFITFMESNGVAPAEPIAQRLASGSLIRFRCEGDGPGRKNGWAILYLDDHPAGAFGNYKQNTGTLKWKSGSDRPPLSSTEREAMQREWLEARKRRHTERLNSERQAALDASDIWRTAKQASSTHPYVIRKNLEVTCLRQQGDRLLIPMFDRDGMLCNLQRIAPDGQKRFLKGGKVDDLFCIVGTVSRRTNEIVIAEGYATADAIHQASGIPTIASFSARNMIRVARLWHEWRPDLEYTIFGDDDRGTEAKTGQNPGRDAALAAAHEIGAKIAFPIGRAA